MPSLLEEKDAIRDVLASYCFHFDNGEFDQWLGLFTDDATFDLGTRGSFNGQDALRRFLASIPLTQGIPQMRHCVMNSIIRVDGPQATAQSYVVVVHGGAVPGVMLAGRYEDRLVKLNGAWKFRERRVQFDLMRGTA